MREEEKRKTSECIIEVRAAFWVAENKVRVLVGTPYMHDMVVVEMAHLAAGELRQVGGLVEVEVCVW